jgi:hypothetical protein
MSELIKILTIGWVGACIRNKDDRDRTLNFFNKLGGTIEGTVKSFIPSATSTDVQNVKPNEPHAETYE